MLSALSAEPSRISGALVSEDTEATARILRALGVGIPSLEAGSFEVKGGGVRGLESPGEVLDCGNSGTSARLLLGVLAGVGLRAEMTGDQSLRSRPMARVMDPLTAMGARFDSLGEPGQLPIRVCGGTLGPIDYRSAIASAQVKSAVLLAGLTSGNWVLYAEPCRSRDHSERMLEALGIPLIEHWHEGAWRVELREPPEGLPGLHWRVPGDFSAAAFWLTYGLLRGGSQPLRIEAVGLNPTRTGLLDVVRRMAGRVEVEALRDGPEPQGDLVVWPSELRATDIGAAEVPSLIDELPVFAILAARAEGRSRVTGAAELRVKESDRIRTIVHNLDVLGAEVGELSDGFEVEGASGPLTGRVRCGGDHRIAMAFAVLGALPEADVEIDQPDAVAVSYPGFLEALVRLSGSSRSSREGARVSAGRRAPVVTIDGPAGSGKSSTARAVARGLGFLHLDSGALYRGLTLAFLRRGWPADTWSERTEAEIEALGLRALPRGGEVEVWMEGARLAERDLRSEAVTAHVSRVAGLPRVRAALLTLQRQAAAEGGLVADGRDMGTVVFPNAEVKVFLTADLTERARRRLLQREGVKPAPGSVRREASRLQGRDFADAHREHAPLRAAPDAHHIDTSALDFEGQVQAVLALVAAQVDAKEGHS